VPVTTPTTHDEGTAPQKRLPSDSGRGWASDPQAGHDRHGQEPEDRAEMHDRTDKLPGHGYDRCARWRRWLACTSPEMRSGASAGGSCVS